MWMSFRRSTSRPHSALAWWSARKLRSTMGAVAERPALVVDRGGVVGGVHEIVEIGDAGAGHGHQGNGDPRACDPGTEASTQDTGIWPQATSMWSLYPVQVSL